MTVTERITRDAIAAGLRPHTGVQVVRGARELIVNGEGRDATFGVVRIGARTGRVLCAYLTHGNSAREFRVDGSVEVARIFRVMAEQAR